MMKRSLSALALALVVFGLLQPMVTARDEPSPGFAWRDVYRTYASMITELQALQAAHPDLVMLEDIGTTYEGRDIWAVKLSDDVTTNDSAEPDVLIFGPVHAREVMGVEVPMFVLNYMIDGYGINETLTRYINTKETWFVPMPNPDGHVYIEQGNDWRKNRRPTTGGNIGVDINRNWGYQFGVDGATSDNPVSEVYHGPYAFSENETIALRDLALRQHFVTSLSYHSVASLILYPWGYTTDPAPAHNELKRMAEAMAAWNGYTPKQSCELYFTHGSSDDWLYGNQSILAFTVELDTAFHPPESQIPISCALNRESTLYLIGYPKADIVDAGVFGLAAPFNNTIIEPDRELNISGRVMNYGSNETDIPVEVLINSGAYSFTNSSSIRLRPGQVGLWNASWLPPLTAGENCSISVRTNLSGDTYSWNDQKDARFRIKAKYGAALESQSGTNQSCYPGESVSFPLLLRSLSNRDDDIKMELTGAKTNWASIDASARLAPAGTKDIELKVAVPRGAVPGETATISVRAFSSTGQGAAGLATTVTKVLDPAPTANAGDDITINVTREIVFDGSRSTTPTGTLVNYSWDFGDGSTSERATVRHAYQKRGFYIVNLTVANELGYRRTDSLNVTVLQEFKVGLSAEMVAVKFSPGETVEINFTVQNDGNGPDVVGLTLVALRWNASIDAENVSLSAGESLRFILRITAPLDAVANSTAFFRVSAQSLESSYARSEVVLTATVREVRDFTFGISNASRRLDGGQMARFTGTFHNGGNIQETANLTAMDVLEGWTADMSQPNVTLPPWSNATVTITVRVPAQALAGEYSFSVNGVELSITVNPRFGLEAAVGNASATLKPGETATFNLTVFNYGNAPDTFAITVGDMPSGWPAATVGQLGILAAGANGTVAVTITVPKNATAGLNVLRLTVRSAGDANQTRVIPVQLTVVRKAVPAATTTLEAFQLILLLLVVIVIAVVVVVAFAASRRKGPPVEAPPAEIAQAEAIPLEPDGRRY